jgi:uncharacterized delta-60 repeat protein
MRRLMHQSRNGKLASLVSIALILTLAFSARASAQAGTLDTSFSGDGKQVTNLTSGLDAIYEVDVQADGRIVVAGEAGGRDDRIGIVRYNPGGSFDSTFSGDGKVLTNFTGGAEYAIDVVLQTDEKIVIAGGIGGQGGRCGIVRYNPGGSLDSTFSGDGRHAINFTPGRDSCHAALIQPDGKIVAGGYAQGQGIRATLVRLNADGSPDATFSGDGKLTRNFTSGIDYFDGLALQADGKIVGVGTADWDRRGSRVLVTRFNPDGSPDSGFSRDGFILANFATDYDGAYAVTVQPADQAIVVGGQAGESMTVLRYLPDGTPDATFSGDGRVVTEVAPTLDYAEEVEIQADGKIVVAGSAAYFRRDSKFLLARYDTTGLPDPTFSGDGEMLINFGSSTDEGYGLALQPTDGKIIIGGRTAGQGGRFALARVNDD